MLIFGTLLIPAMLIRTIDLRSYALYSTALAALPLLSIIPQSLRTGAASQLSLAFARAPEAQVKLSFLRFTLLMTIMNSALAIAAIEAYLSLQWTDQENHATLRFGLYCLTGNVAGLMVATAVTGPASAYRNFLPDNAAKVWPSVFVVAGIATLWLVSPRFPLLWIFLIYLASTWSIALALILRHAGKLFARPDDGWARHLPTERMLAAGVRGIAWWNLTAYLATTAAVLIVAIGHAKHIVAFSIATSLLGVVSAGLIAVASPLSGHAAALFERDHARVRPFFLWVNSGFQLYIFVTTAAVALIPQSLLALWLTPDIAGEVRWFCLLLLPSYVLRLLTMAFTLFVMSAGRQHYLWLSPMVEAFLSVTGSIALGTWLGVTGIPLALALSALVRLLMTVFYDGPRHNGTLGFSKHDLLWSAVRLFGCTEGRLPLRDGVSMKAIEPGQETGLDH
jgi:hypothetical protein